MARGQKTPANVEALFKAAYLATGLARTSARIVGISEKTGQDLAVRAEADPEFRRLRATLLPTAVSLTLSRTLRASEIVGEALEAGPLLDGMGNPIDRIGEKAQAQAAIFKAIESAHSKHLEREAQNRAAAAGTDRPTRIEIVRFTRAPETAPETPPDEQPCKSE